MISGKSSVLEGLTNLPYPRGSGLCTRFATQIIFQRAQQQKTRVSIIPSANCATDQADRLREWNKDDVQSLEGGIFYDILKEVCFLFPWLTYGLSTSFLVIHWLISPPGTCLNGARQFRSQ